MPVLAVAVLTALAAAAGYATGRHTRTRVTIRDTPAGPTVTVDRPGAHHIDTDRLGRIVAADLRPHLTALARSRLAPGTATTDGPRRPIPGWPARPTPDT